MDRFYIKINKEAYEALADEYFERLQKYDTYYRDVGMHLAKYIMSSVDDEENVKSVLEIGCGPGAILKAISELGDFSISAIDFSQKMVQNAKKSCPSAHIINTNILDIENINDIFLVKEGFDIIIMAAFIHLFPYEDAKIILKILRASLNENGIIYIDTTKEDKFIDGTISEKTGYKNKVVRLRTRWTIKKFDFFLDECGFQIVKQIEHQANNGKIWMRTIIKAQK